MKTMKYLSLLALPAIILSCKDDKPVNNNDLSNLHALYQELKSDVQEFTVSAGASEDIIGALGTVIHFYPNSFKDKNGNTINSGNVKIYLTEVLDPKHMIANRVQTVTQSERLLTSGGAIHLVAVMGNDTLETNGYGIEFNQRNNNLVDTMALYPGYTVNNIGGATVNWYDDTTGTTISKRRQDPDSFSSYYNFDSCFNFGWVNCDFYNNYDDPKTNIGVVMPNGDYNNNNTEVIIVDKRANIVASLSGYNSNSRAFMAHSPNYYLPIGTEISVIIIGSINDQVVADTFKNITVTNNHTLNADPKPATAAEVGLMISEL